MSTIGMEVRAMEIERQLLSGTPMDVECVIFRPYRTGPARHEWQNDDGTIIVWDNAFRSTYSVSVEKKLIGTAFRSVRTAMAAGVKALKAIAL